jgi:hypothetical protein
MATEIFPGAKFDAPFALDAYGNPTDVRSTNYNTAYALLQHWPDPQALGLRVERRLVDSPHPRTLALPSGRSERSEGHRQARQSFLLRRVVGLRGFREFHGSRIH